MDRYLWLLHKSLDGTLTVQEEKQLHGALKKYPVLKQRLREMEEMKEILDPGDLSFSRGFADRVMENILNVSLKNSGIQDSWNSLLSVFKPLAMTGAVAALVLGLLNIMPPPSSLQLTEGSDNELMDELLNGYTDQILGDFL